MAEFHTSAAKWTSVAPSGCQSTPMGPPVASIEPQWPPIDPNGPKGLNSIWIPFGLLGPMWIPFESPLDPISIPVGFQLDSI